MSEWDGILREGEEILWQGAPDKRLRWDDVEERHILGALAALVLVGMVLPVLVRTGAGSTALLVGIATGVPAMLFALAEPLMGKPARRRRSFYTLTNRAAYIGLKGERRSVERYEIGPDMPLDVIGSGDRGTVIFHEEWVGDEDGGHLRRTGFEHIADAEHVFALMSDLRGTPSGNVLWNRPVIRA